MLISRKAKTPAKSLMNFYIVPGAGLEHYMFSTPIGWIDALCFQSSSIGFQVRATLFLQKNCAAPGTKY